MKRIAVALIVAVVSLSGCVMGAGVAPSRPHYHGGGYYPPPQIYPVYPAPQTCRRYVQPGGHEIYRCN